MTLRRWVEVVVEDAVMMTVLIPVIGVLHLASAIAHRWPMSVGRGPEQSRPS